MKSGACARKSIVAALSFFTAFLPAFDTSLAGEVLVGRWLEPDPGSVLRMDDPDSGYAGKWQTSGLTYDSHTGIWWSIGDQNTREAVAGSAEEEERNRSRYVLRLSFSDEKVFAKPYPLEWQRDVLKVVLDSFKGSDTGNIDFEGIAADPQVPNRLYACSEGETPWLVEMEYRPGGDTVAVTRALRLETATDLRPECTANMLWEGIALAGSGRTIFLVTECDMASRRLYEIQLDEFHQAGSKGSNGRWIPASISPRPSDVDGLEGALTGLCAVVRLGTEYLLALKRNPEPPEIYVVNITSSSRPAPVRRVPLDLRAPATDGRPEGIPLLSASPEGIGTDGHRLVIITDPWALLYRPADPDETQVDREKLRRRIPLVFEIELAKILPPDP